MKASTVARLALLLLLSAAFVLVPNGASPPVIWVCLVIFYVQFAAVFRSPARVGTVPSYINVRSLFLTFYYILFFYPYQLYVLDRTDLSVNAFVSRTFPEFTNASILLSTIGIVAFNIGMRWEPRIKLRGEQFSRARSPETHHRRILFLLGILQLLVAVGFYLTGWSSLFVDNYATSTTGDSQTDGLYFLMSHFAMMGLAVSLIFFYWYRRMPPAGVFCILISSAWAVALLVAGDRNTFFLLAVVVATAVFGWFFRAGRLTLACMFLLALVLYNAVEIARSSGDRSISSIVSSIGQDSPSSNSLDQGSLAITTATSRAALYAVPDQYGYFWGKFKVIGFAGVIPFSRGVLLEQGDALTTSSKVLGQTMLGSAATWGVGSNVVSDIYMDFGLPGVAIVMVMLGAFGKWVTRKAQFERGMTWIVIYLLTVALFAELPRYSLDFPVRNLVWAYALFWMYGKVSRWR